MSASLFAAAAAAVLSCCCCAVGSVGLDLYKDKELVGYVKQIAQLFDKHESDADRVDAVLGAHLTNVTNVTNVTNLSAMFVSGRGAPESSFLLPGAPDPSKLSHGIHFQGRHFVRFKFKEFFLSNLELLPDTKFKLISLTPYRSGTYLIHLNLNRLNLRGTYEEALQSPLRHNSRIFTGKQGTFRMNLNKAELLALVDVALYEETLVVKDIESTLTSDSYCVQVDSDCESDKQMNLNGIIFEVQQELDNWLKLYLDGIFAKHVNVSKLFQNDLHFIEMYKLYQQKKLYLSGKLVDRYLRNRGQPNATMGRFSLYTQDSMWLEVHGAKMEGLQSMHRAATLKVERHETEYTVYFLMSFGRLSLHSTYTATPPGPGPGPAGRCPGQRQVRGSVVYNLPSYRAPLSLTFDVELKEVQGLRTPRSNIPRFTKCEVTSTGPLDRMHPASLKPTWRHIFTLLQEQFRTARAGFTSDEEDRTVQKLSFKFEHPSIKLAKWDSYKTLATVTSDWVDSLKTFSRDLEGSVKKWLPQIIKKTDKLLLDGQLRELEAKIQSYINSFEGTEVVKEKLAMVKWLQNGYAIETKINALRDRINSTEDPKTRLPLEHIMKLSGQFQPYPAVESFAKMTLLLKLYRIMLYAEKIKCHSNTCRDLNKNHAYRASAAAHRFLVEGNALTDAILNDESESRSVELMTNLQSCVDEMNRYTVAMRGFPDTLCLFRLLEERVEETFKFVTFSSSPCKYYQFRCSNGQCVEHGAYCDGVRHCDDGSDETYCDRSVDVCPDPQSAYCPTLNICVDITPYCCEACCNRHDVTTPGPGRVTTKHEEHTAVQHGTSGSSGSSDELSTKHSTITEKVTDTTLNELPTTTDCSLTEVFTTTATFSNTIYTSIAQPTTPITSTILISSQLPTTPSTSTTTKSLTSSTIKPLDTTELTTTKIMTSNKKKPSTEDKITTSTKYEWTTATESAPEETESPDSAPEEESTTKQIKTKRSTTRNKHENSKTTNFETSSEEVQTTKKLKSKTPTKNNSLKNTMKTRKPTATLETVSKSNKSSKKELATKNKKKPTEIKSHERTKKTRKTKPIPKVINKTDETFKKNSPTKTTRKIRLTKTKTNEITKRSSKIDTRGVTKKKNKKKTMPDQDHTVKTKRTERSRTTKTSHSVSKQDKTSNQDHTVKTKRSTKNKTQDKTKKTPKTKIPDSDSVPDKTSNEDYTKKSSKTKRRIKTKRTLKTKSPPYSGSEPTSSSIEIHTIKTKRSTNKGRSVKTKRFVRTKTKVKPKKTHSTKISNSDSADDKTSNEDHTNKTKRSTKINRQNKTKKTLKTRTPHPDSRRESTSSEDHTDKIKRSTKTKTNNKTKTPNSESDSSSSEDYTDTTKKPYSDSKSDSSSSEDYTDTTKKPYIDFETNSTSSEDYTDTSKTQRSDSEPDSTSSEDHTDKTRRLSQSGSHDGNKITSKIRTKKTASKGHTIPKTNAKTKITRRSTDNRLTKLTKYKTNTYSMTGTSSEHCTTVKTTTSKRARKTKNILPISSTDKEHTFAMNKSTIASKTTKPSTRTIFKKPNATTEKLSKTTKPKSTTTRSPIEGFNETQHHFWLCITNCFSNISLRKCFGHSCVDLLLPPGCGNVDLCQCTTTCFKTFGYYCSGIYLPMYVVCDGKIDCHDGADERNCKMTNCDIRDPCETYKDVERAAQMIYNENKCNFYSCHKLEMIRQAVRADTNSASRHLVLVKHSPKKRKELLYFAYQVFARIGHLLEWMVQGVVSSYVHSVIPILQKATYEILYFVQCS